MGIRIKLGKREQLVPAGEYNVVVSDIREGTFVNKRKTLEFTFEIADGPHQGVSLRGFVNAHYESFSEYTKLRKWAAAVSKIDSDPGSELDMDLFLEKVIRVVVETKRSRKTGNEFSNVTEVLALVHEL